MRMRINAEDIEKVKGSAEKRPGMGEYVTTNHIRNHHGITTFFLAATDMQGLWQHPKHNIGPAVSHGSQAATCNLVQPVAGVSTGSRSCSICGK